MDTHVISYCNNNTKFINTLSGQTAGVTRFFFKKIYIYIWDFVVKVLYVLCAPIFVSIHTLSTVLTLLVGHKPSNTTAQHLARGKRTSDNTDCRYTRVSCITVHCHDWPKKETWPASKAAFYIGSVQIYTCKVHDTKSSQDMERSESSLSIW